MAQRLPFQVSLTAGTNNRPDFRTNYHYTIPASAVKGDVAPATRAAEVACELALKDGLIAPVAYTVVKGRR